MPFRILRTRLRQRSRSVNFAIPATGSHTIEKYDKSDNNWNSRIPDIPRIFSTFAPDLFSLETEKTENV